MINKTSYLELLLIAIIFISAFALPGQGVLLGFIIVIVYTLIGNRKKKISDLGFNAPISISRLLIFTLIFGFAMELIFQILLEPIIELATVSKLDISNFDAIKGDVKNYAIMLLIGWVVGGFLEELLFRGFLINKIAGIFKNENLGNIIAIFSTSIVFGLSHLYQDWAGVISTGLISIILGVVYIRMKKNLWYTILIHGFNNTLATTIIYLDLSNEIDHLIF